MPKVQSAHTLGEVAAPLMRMADGKTDEEQLNVPLGQGENAECCAYVFARIYKTGDSWALHYIGEHKNGDEVEDWAETLQTYIQ